jgi:hypothetical protein
MAKTALLPPATAVRMAWAMTGQFSKDELSGTMANYAVNDLKKIEDQTQARGINSNEKSYVTSAVATIRASLRSLENAYKGRTLNFEENDKLRETYLEQVKESLAFGNTAQDFLKSLPAMTISTAGGLTVAQALGISGVALWGLGLALAALGYLVNLYFVRRARYQTQILYIKQDFDRDLYYDQYIGRVKNILHGLFLDLERNHNRIFGENYEADMNKLEGLVSDILKGVPTTLCPYAKKHMGEGKIKPELWAQCESGDDEAVHACRLWEGRKLILGSKN